MWTISCLNCPQDCILAPSLYLAVPATGTAQKNTSELWRATAGIYTTTPIPTWLGIAIGAEVFSLHSHRALAPRLTPSVRSPRSSNWAAPRASALWAPPSQVPSPRAQGCPSPGRLLGPGSPRRKFFPSSPGLASRDQPPWLPTRV
jgi:hypothetical protein